MIPVDINIYPTMKCNLQCAHCMHECSPSRTEQMTEQQENIFKLFTGYVISKGIMISNISISGGQPFLYPRIYDIINHISTLNKTYSIPCSICTNGTIPIDNTKLKYSDLFSFNRGVVRISSSIFHDEQLKRKGISQKFDKFFNICQQPEIHRVVMISDKGRGKDVVKEYSPLNSVLHCFREDRIQINFKPQFVSFCSQDDSEIDQYKYLYWNNVDVYSLDKIVEKAYIFNARRACGLCQNKCTHYIVPNSR